MDNFMVKLPVEILAVEREKITFVFPFCKCFSEPVCSCQGVKETVKKELISIADKDKDAPVLWQTGPAAINLPGWLLQKMQNRAFHGKSTENNNPEIPEWISEIIDSHKT